jgi:hypothetical protein
MCDVGIYPCVHDSNASDESGEISFYYGRVTYFDPYCSTDCKILVGVYGTTDSEYVLEMRVGMEFFEY